MSCTGRYLDRYDVLAVFYGLDSIKLKLKNHLSCDKSCVNKYPDKRITYKKFQFSRAINCGNILEGQSWCKNILKCISIFSLWNSNRINF